MKRKPQVVWMVKFDHGGYSPGSMGASRREAIENFIEIYGLIPSMSTWERCKTESGCTVSRFTPPKELA